MRYKSIDGQVQIIPLFASTKKKKNKQDTIDIVHRLFPINGKHSITNYSQFVLQKQTKRSTKRMNPSSTAEVDVATVVLETDNNSEDDGQIFIGHNRNSKSNSNSSVNATKRNKSGMVSVGEEDIERVSSGRMCLGPAGPGETSEGGTADADAPPQWGGRYGKVVEVGSECSYDDYSNDEDGNSSMMSFLSRATASEDASQSPLCSTTSMSASSELNTQQQQNYYWHEPIKVGYAFGPKKMTTMGVVMAEASRVQVIHEEEEEEEEEEENDVGDVAVEDDCEVTESPLQINNEKGSSYSIEDTNNSCPTAPHSSLSSSPKVATSTRTTVETTKLTSHALRNLVDSTTKNDENDGQVSTIICLNNTDETDIRHIVRYFRSNCSSAAGSFAGSMSETTTSTPTTAYGTCSTTCGNSTVYDPLQKNRKCHVPPHLSQKQRRGGTGTSAGRQRMKRSRRHPVHISFVPLDCDQPLEDQHGGNFDLILHKLTEDILACSLMDGEGSAVGRSDRTPRNRGSIDGLRNVAAEDNEASRQRVQSLKKYQQNHDFCCLVDDPSNVQIVMSRSDIADVLRDCLRGVYSASGIPVRSPRFVVIGDRETDDDEVLGGCDRSDHDAHDSISYSQRKRLKEQLLQEEISMPVIVKPLIAAGTKQSHSMLVALQDSAILKLPCKTIVQEYVNHNATLYKVYVLGDFVSVFDRPSLPNLPNDVSSRATTDLVKFDSQRPYPNMNDFGLDAGRATVKEVSVESRVKVTADEVRPIVDVLKNAFGLEMFGFDVIHGEDGEFLVVDVNYFPSYKEVKDFPFLLARYLTQRVLEQRRKKREAEKTDMERKEVLPSAGFEV